MKRILILAFVLLGGIRQAYAAAVIRNLQVEDRNTPLGIDVTRPRFSWQMATTAGERGYAQTAYLIEVRDPNGRVIWDTKRTESSDSLGLKYGGNALRAATRYSWTVTVWDQAGAKLAARSWFETGFMDPASDSSAWGGAKWIGGGNEDLVLYSPYLAIFDVTYALTIAPGSTRASFVYGANDSRLMDKNRNIYQVESGKDQSYIKVELDLSGVNGAPQYVREAQSVLQCHVCEWRKEDAGDRRGGFGVGGRGATTGPPEFRVADSQTSYAVGLGMDLFNSEDVPQMVKNLAETVVRENKDDDGTIRPKYSLMTGFIGTSWISKALSDSGLSELAYRILHNNQYPSWLYAVDQGATSIWERLNGYTVENGFGGNNSMNSFNHYSFGAVGQWMMAYSLGIQRDEPGFQKFMLRPEPDPTGVMTSAEGYYDSMYGRIDSAWKIDGGRLTYRATVPANTTATLYLPAGEPKTVKESGKDAGAAKGVAFVEYKTAERSTA